MIRLIESSSGFLEAGPLVLAASGVGALVIFAVVTWLVWKADLRIYLGIVLALSVVQIFRPAGYISIALIVTALGLPGLLLRTRLRYWDLWTKALFTLLIAQVLSLLWMSKVGAVALAALSTLAIGAVYIAVRVIMESKPDFNLSLYIASPFLLAESALIVLFRVAPDPSRWVYLSTWYAPFFSEPEVVLIGGGHQENVLDINKSGGTFLNANIASLFMATAAILFLWAAVRSRNRYLAVVGAILALTVPFTGSKSPILIAAIVTGLVIVLVLTARRMWRLLAGLVAAGLLVIGAVAVIRPQIYAFLFETMDDRWKLWGLSWLAIGQHPILGLGYGNWEYFIRWRWTAIFGTDRPEQILPPHNFMFAAWTDGGIVVAAMSVLLAVVAVVWASMSLYRSASVPGRGWIGPALALAGVLWVPLHGVTDTTGFFGENHVLAYYAVFVAIVAASRASGKAPDGVASAVPSRRDVPRRVRARRARA